jgi:ABC-type transport system involved in multi-copper enzyme maturation permease subunit
MTQLLAILQDTYRELSSRRLFWLSLMLSALVVLSFALVGINEEGVQIVVWTLDIPFLNTRNIAAGEFYKLTFYGLGVRFWLGWLACLLALVSSAGLFPEMVAGGTVETLLARPVPRWRLFLFKFLGGLLFTALQVGVFCTASFLVIGLRGNAWEPGIFIAVPMVTILYSYLFSVCALLGAWTRSGIAALLLTVLFWGFLFLLNTSEQLVNSFRIARLEEFAAIDRTIEKRRQKDPEASVQDLMDEREAGEPGLAKLVTAHRILFAAKTLLPKTDETTALVQRWIVDVANLGDVADEGEDGDMTGPPAPRRRGRGSFGTTRARESDVRKAIERDLESRGVGWIVGTSLLFEGVVLVLGCRHFSRRDF